MKKQILCAAVVAAIALGCSSSKQGGTGDNADRATQGAGGSSLTSTVLNSGPTSGVTVNSLPQPVKDTLQQQVPNAQINSIDKQYMNGKNVYNFTFTDPSRYPSLQIADDGTLQQQPPLTK